MCEIEISELPEGFFVVEDNDIMDKTNTPHSEILISRFDSVPGNCISISKVLDTDDVVKDYPSRNSELGYS